jgi:hypothetical protein
VTVSAYQRIRLWSGIVSIGSNLGIIWAIYLSAFWWSGNLDAVVSIAILIALPFGLVLANLPFEILTGHACETAVGRTNQSLRAWLEDWSRGALPAACAQVFGLLLFYFASSWNGPFKWVLVTALVMVVTILVLASLPLRLARRAAIRTDELIEFEKALALEFSELKVSAPQICWVADADLTTVNGAIPIFGKTLFLSENVAGQLLPREAALMAVREVWFVKSGTARAASAIAILWLLAGVLLALGIPGVSALQCAIGGAAVVTTWCFVALFVWPAWNRSRMEQADRSLLGVATLPEVQELLAKVQQLNATDTELPPGKAAVFHPIPPMQDRIRSLS